MLYFVLSQNTPDDQYFQKVFEEQAPVMKQVIDDIFRAENGLGTNEDVGEKITMDYYEQTSSSVLLGFFLSLKMQEPENNEDFKYLNDEKILFEYLYNKTLEAYRNKIASKSKDWCDHNSIINKTIGPNGLAEAFVKSPKVNLVLKRYELPLFISATVVVKDKNKNILDIKQEIFGVPKLDEMRRDLKAIGLKSYEADAAILFQTEIIDLQKIQNRDFYISIDNNHTHTVHYINDDNNITATFSIDLSKTSHSHEIKKIEDSTKTLSLEMELREVFIKD